MVLGGIYMCLNDKTIFNYFNPSDNDILSSFNHGDKKEILSILNKYYLEYRNKLDISSDITFGIEIEMEHFKGTVEDFRPFEVAINNIVGNEDWTIKNDITLRWGRELASQIYIDDVKTWKDIKEVCEYASLYGTIDTKCAGHVNIGTQILGNNPLYWYRFLKIWSAYENVIYRFGYGEFLNYFPFILYSGKPISKIFYDNMEMFSNNANIDVFSVIKGLQDPSIPVEFIKKNAVSFYKMYGVSRDYDMVRPNCVIEIRNNLGTLDEIIWQNYCNFYIKMMLYCKSDRFDDDIIDRRLSIVKDELGNINVYNQIYVDQALELSDLIFNNNMDKLYFLRQYIKSFDISKIPGQMARRLTSTNRSYK